MNLKEIKEIIGLMNENGLAEVDWEHEGVKLRLKKGGADPVASFVHAAPVVSAPAAQPAAAAPSSAESSKKSSNSVDIVSPMVGTFYRAPSPESPPFVEAGQIVEVGQVVCIVEAMKLMNEIKAEVRGKVVDVLVNNAEPVEFGQPLFRVEAV